MIPQVCSVLESLEQEYRRDEDWCGGRDKLGPAAEMDHVIPLLSKHLEQKEAFLKVSVYCHTGLRFQPRPRLSPAPTFIKASLCLPLM
jgi:hypothetical protein